MTGYGLAAINLAPRFTVVATPGAIGASRWLAPEILNPFHGSDGTLVVESKPADVFAFAMVAVEVFTGKVPFEGRRNEAVVVRILQGQRPEMPVNFQGVGLTDETWKLLKKCWQQSPGKRPTMKEVVRRWEMLVEHGDGDNDTITEYAQVIRVVRVSSTQPP